MEVEHLDDMDQYIYDITSGKSNDPVAKIIMRQYTEDVLTIALTDEGKRFISTLCKKCFVFNTATTPEQLGARNIAVEILNIVRKHNPNIMGEITKE